ncbi:hypothetical protein PMI42_00702 [Bradyrhizobium sp. YR681]|uniref:hypothetical protein n=1 Tax=Bradyrhizobium sp. YR681 TaxID=1144344 RepID=UPI000270DED6|nr:hypothetical protein [Bradyrhizobium sp. YR681]EJN15685.1 hypothetical protein PMI42_00702 [Bradyrhizobium sp. YR681]
MPEVWPNTLPQQLQLSGASLGYGNALVEYAPDLGPSLSRRGSSAVMKPLAGSMILSDAQVTIWEAFFNSTIMSGSLPFTFPDPRTGADLLVKFTKGGPPSLAPLGGDNYRLNLALVILP